MSVDEKWHVVQVVRRKCHDPENIVKIDGKLLEGVRNVEISYGIKEPYPIVKIEFYAKEIKGTVESGNIEKSVT